jgi:putative inorganic carbon (hco3(-)) transporter
MNLNIGVISMKLYQRELSILLIGILAVIAGLLIGNTKVALAISFLIAVAGILKKELGLLFLLVFIPVRPFLITVNPGFKILGDMIIFFLLARTVFDYRKDWKKLFSFHPFEWCFFAFAAIGVISALLTGVTLQAIIFQLRAYFLFYIVFYVVKRMELSLSKIRLMSITTFSVAILLSLQGIIEKISNKTMLMPQEWQEWVLSPTNRIRVYGLLKGPNELSLYLVIAFIVTLLLLKQIHGKAKYFVYIGLTLMVTTIMLTYSRGTLLTLIVFLFLYILVKRQWRPLVPIGLILLISFGLFTAVNQAANQYYDYYLAEDSGDMENSEKGEKVDEKEEVKRFKNAFSEETIGQSSTSGRIYYVKKAIEVFKDHPLIGTGFATFGGAATLSYTSPIYDDYEIENSFYSDNQYILILVETGILGVLSILITSYFLLMIIVKQRKEFYWPLLVYLFTAVIVGGTVYNILENDTFMLYFFLLLGIVFQKGKWKPEH